MTQAHPPAAPELVRLCAAFTTTQLLPLIHILRYAQLPPGRNVLLTATETLPEPVQPFYEAVANSHPFAQRVDLSTLTVADYFNQRNFINPLPLIANFRKNRQWLLRCIGISHIRRDSVELWTDEPFTSRHRFLHAIFSDATRVKYPHGFNLEDSVSPLLRENLRRKLAGQVKLPHHILWSTVSLTTGARITRDMGLRYERAYTFDKPSPFASTSINVNKHYTMDSLAALYQALPADKKKDVLDLIAQASDGSGDAWVILSLYVLTPERQRGYLEALVNLQKAHPDLLAGARIVLKPHPLANPTELGEFAKKIEELIGVPTRVFPCPLNFEIIWHQLPKIKALITAPCGVVPFVRRFGLTRVFLAGSLLREFSAPGFSNEPVADELVAGCEVL